jgi:hypothetical protein
MAIFKDMHPCYFNFINFFFLILATLAIAIGAKGVIMKTRTVSLQALTLFAIAAGL